MDATPLHTLAKFPQNLAPLPIFPRFRSFPEMWCRLAAAAGQVLQLHPVACEFTPACGPELMRVPELLPAAKKR